MNVVTIVAMRGAHRYWDSDPRQNLDMIRHPDDYDTGELILLCVWGLSDTTLDAVLYSIKEPRYLPGFTYKTDGDIVSESATAYLLTVWPEPEPGLDRWTR